MSEQIKRIALGLLKDCYEDEIAHLQLRMIRDAQEPRFEAIKGEHPEIWEDFQKARIDCHEVLLRNRRKRETILRSIIEGDTFITAPNAMGKSVDINWRVINGCQLCYGPLSMADQDTGTGECKKCRERWAHRTTATEEMAKDPLEQKRVCRVCGDIYDLQDQYIGFCSKECRQAYEKSREGEDKETCLECSGELPGKAWIFCSTKCYEAWECKGAENTLKECEEDIFAPESSTAESRSKMHWAADCCQTTHISQKGVKLQTKCQQCGEFLSWALERGDEEEQT